MPAVAPSAGRCRRHHRRARCFAAPDSRRRGALLLLPSVAFRRPRHCTSVVRCVVARALPVTRHSRSDAWQRPPAGRVAADHRGAARRQSGAGRGAVPARGRRTAGWPRTCRRTTRAHFASRSNRSPNRSRIAWSPARFTSPAFDVTVVRPPRITRIDVEYRYPDALGLQPRTEEDSGDIYAPAGTNVRLLVHTDREVASGEMSLGGGQCALPLAAAPGTPTAQRRGARGVAHRRTRRFVPRARRRPRGHEQLPARPSTSSACSTIVRRRCAS